jgi:site-specific DNA recombinase
MREAAVYYRVSTSNQTLESQKELAYQMAKQNNCRIIAEFQDIAVSGVNLTREGLDQFYKWVEQNQGKAAIVPELSRIDRSIYGTNRIKFMMLCKQYHVKPISDLPETTSEELDALLGAVYSFKAAQERKDIKRRMMGSKISRLKEGIPIVSKVPFGYTYIRRTPTSNPKIILNSDEAEIVKTIFDLYTKKRHSISGICKYLTVKKIKTQNGNTIWMRSTVRQILVRECYSTGKLPYFQYQFEHNGVRSVRGKQKPRSEWVFVDVDKIVDRESFDLAQSKLKTNVHKSPNNRKYDYLLSSLIKCGVCGRPYQAYTNLKNMRGYYRCSFRNTIDENGKHITCINRQVTAVILEPRIWEQVKYLDSNPEIIRKQIVKVLKSINESKKHITDRIVVIEKSLDKLEKRKETFISAYNTGKFKLPDLEMYIKNYEEQKIKYQSEIQENKKKLEGINPIYESTISFDNYLNQDRVKNLKDLARSMFYIKRDLVLKYVRQIIVLPEKNKYRIEFVIPVKDVVINTDDSSCRFKALNYTIIHNTPLFFTIIKDININYTHLWP